MIRNQYIQSDDPFFDHLKPCPERIPDCEKLRENYLKDIEDIKKLLIGVDLSETECCSSPESIVKEKYLNLIATKINETRSIFETDLAVLKLSGFEEVKRVYENTKF